MYIYIYICIITYDHMLTYYDMLHSCMSGLVRFGVASPCGAKVLVRQAGSMVSLGKPALRPISPLRSPLLRSADSKLPGDSPMDMRIPPLNIKILLESSPLKSRIVVQQGGGSARRFVSIA